jgi:hypothetical protein
VILGRKIVTNQRTRGVHCNSREGVCNNSQDQGSFIVILGREIVTTPWTREVHCGSNVGREIVTTHGTRGVHCDSKEGECNNS